MECSTKIYIKKRFVDILAEHLNPQKRIIITKKRKEVLAIKNGIAKFTFFLLPKQFKVRYNNTQVKGFKFNKLPNLSQYKRLIRW